MADKRSGEQKDYERINSCDALRELDGLGDGFEDRKSEEEAIAEVQERIMQGRRILASKILNNIRIYPKAAEALGRYEAGKNEIPLGLELKNRTCPVCEQDYVGPRPICDICIDEYEHRG